MERRDGRVPAPDRHRGGPGPAEGRAGDPGPRQDYLDAFDVFGAHDTYDPLRRTGEQADGVQRAPSVPAQRSGGRRARPMSPAASGKGAGHRKSRQGWARSLLGVTSAALVTVLVVLLAGQLARPDEEDAPGRAERFALEPDGGADARPMPPDGAENSGEAGGGGSEQVDEPVVEPGHDELMETTFPLDPDLTGSGELVPVAGSEPAADPDARTLLRYRVDVEEGLGIDAEFFAEVVHRTLSDERSWGNAGERGFARVSEGDYDFVVTLASPGTTADWCARSGLDTTEDNVSCNSSSTERVMINAWRFAQGSETYGDEIADYRRMLVNHEVGHRLGYGHAVCPGEGALAPVMMQQTKFLSIDGVTCAPNAWPHPNN
ncbi:DUF3152 domain-containing protein [Streptomyces profundus]|uniref:DUF3152 domain-containing protein n=1 Tax=Streptomyces profundus TaxID=2867410 RepID=UPI001D16D5F7|nr:DUF3152 domain-containing protein [Streptomyces sp. MA3_2.13]UED84322.1 DUF3152 domain-containing protein [Streptomyces sp. MA3_2.13]